MGRVRGKAKRVIKFARHDRPITRVSWRVRAKVAKVNIASVGEWCKGKVCNEDHAHGVRNLVMNPDLLSSIQYA